MMPPDHPADPAPPAVAGQLADFLAGRRERLLHLWVETLRRNVREGTVPASTDDRGLINHLPHLFDDLVATLRGERTSEKRTARDAESHGQVRWEQHYTLSEMLRELGIVSRQLLKHGLDAFALEHPGVARRELEPVRDTLLRFFEDTVCASSDQFVQQQQERTDVAHQELHREERLLAAAVQSNYERLAALFQNAPFFLALLRGPGHVFHLANDQYHRITGHRELLGQSVREALPEVVAQGFTDLLDRVYATGQSYVGKDVRILLQSGTGAPPQEHFIDFVYLPTRAADGTVDGIVVHGVDWTERRRAEAALRESEVKYRTLFDSIDEAFAVLEIIRDEADQPVDYRFVEVNPAMERHTGWKDARGKTARELTPGLEDYWPQTYGKVERTGESIRFVQGAAGLGRVFDAYAFRIGPAERPQVAILFQDVTAQRATAAMLAEVAEQRRLALDSAQMGWWHYDPATGAVDWDERARALYGLDDKHVSYAQAVATIHPQDLPRRDAAFQAAISPESASARYEVEYRVGRPDGSWRWLQVRGSATFAGEGAQRRLAGMDGTVVDVTAAKTSQAALLESEGKFRQLADSMPQIVWAANPAGVVDYYNQRWYDYTGTRPVSEASNKTWEQVVNEEDERHIYAVWNESVRTGQPYEAEYRIRRASDGMLRWHLGRAVPIRDGAGRIVRWYGTNTDIHERKELLKRNEELLESERAARTQVERTSQMKDEFLATLSHELRTPLNAILGWTQVLRGPTTTPEDVADGLTIIERNARAQTQIIEDLLDMSKIISGKVRLDVQSLHLDQVVSAAVDTMRPAAAAKDIRLQTLIDPQARMISGDPNRLQQVFWNLLSNAIKFTPKGGKVQAILQRVDSHLEVSVADTGEGVAPEFLPYIFDRFRQQDASTTRKHGGLGLGLAIVKQLVELHGGSIRAESPGAGQGTTFRVTLPLSAVQSAPEPAAPERRHPQQGEAPALSVPAELLDLTGVKVLVVDDEADAQGLVRRLLEDRGAVVHTAGSVGEALARLQAERPDVLVSDIGMPGEDGYSLLRRVRALKPEEGGQTPAIALTAYARAEDRLKAMFAGFQVHVSKPVNGVELLALVANLKGRTGSF